MCRTVIVSSLKVLFRRKNNFKGYFKSKIYGNNYLVFTLRASSPIHIAMCYRDDGSEWLDHFGNWTDKCRSKYFIRFGMVRPILLIWTCWIRLGRNLNASHGSTLSATSSRSGSSLEYVEMYFPSAFCAHIHLRACKWHKQLEIVDINIR